MNHLERDRFFYSPNDLTHCCTDAFWEIQLSLKGQEWPPARNRLCGISPMVHSISARMPDYPWRRGPSQVSYTARGMGVCVCVCMSVGAGGRNGDGRERKWRIDENLSSPLRNTQARGFPQEPFLPRPQLPRPSRKWNCCKSCSQVAGYL